MLGKDFGPVNAARAKSKVNVPEWLTRAEVRALFLHLYADWLLLAQLGYGTGLRLMELLRLRVKDVDVGNRLIYVRDGKGAKDRLVPLPVALIPALANRMAATLKIHQSDCLNGFGRVLLPGALARKYPRAATDPKWQYLFPSREICRAPDGQRRRHHLFPNGFQTALRLAGVQAGIKKRVHPHLLRHTFATHFLENGGNLQTLQHLLGHKHVETTMIYTHCVDLRRARSPLDFLEGIIPA